MAIEIRASDDVTAVDDVIGVPFYSGLVLATTVAVEIDLSYLDVEGFEGNAGQVQPTQVEGRTVVAIGLGDPTDLTLDGLRKAAALFARSSSKHARATFIVPDLAPGGLDATAVGQVVAEGVLLGLYRFNAYKSKPDLPKLETVTLVGADAVGVARGENVAKAVSLARDLVNHPAAAMTPTRLAKVAKDVAESAGLDLTVLDEIAIRNERLGGLLGVAAGSDEAPRLIELSYVPDDATATLVLVGKGITFDSGGLSLKPAEGMMTMKKDMSGAAAVIAAMSVIPSVAPKTKVIAIVLATENLPGPSATKPGDVLRARNGKTIEVLNTDAEGRLVLADGLSLAVEAEADAIIDVATLTGACIVALGDEIAGLFANNDAFAKQVEAAADRAGENVWRLPMPGQYRKHIDSEIADIKNIGAPKGAAGSITAALFLKEFVEEVPWVHLDIAGPARAGGSEGYVQQGGTGFAVRTLIEAARTFTKP